MIRVERGEGARRKGKGRDRKMERGTERKREGAGYR